MALETHLPNNLRGLYFLGYIIEIKIKFNTKKVFDAVFFTTHIKIVWVLKASHIIVLSL